METQEDYEAEVFLAVFLTATAARDAQRALEAIGVPSRQSPLSPGNYQVADARLGSRVRASIGAGIIGAVIGALIGVGLAVWLFGAGLAVIVGLAVAGAIGGAIIGPLFGIERTSRYDNDVASTIDVTPGSAAILVRAEASTGTGGHARRALADAGAIALLDVSAYEARTRGTAEPTIVASTSAGDAAAPGNVPRLGQRHVQETDKHAPRPAA
jgi:hypothetical protein